MFLGELKWTEVENLTERVVVVPLGSLEQHGHHLPLLTDTLIGTEIARRAEVELGDEALFLPPLWVGASDHHRAFAGTVSISNAVYVDVLIDIMESLLGSGFRRIFLLNAHGGNITPGRMALYEVQLRHRDKPDMWLAFSSWWTIAAEQVAALTNVKQEMVTHACEQESSMILRIRPELVRPEAARGANIPFESAFYFPDFSQPSRVDVPKAFDQLSRTGAFGHPEIAEAEKGESLFAAAVTEVVAFVREFATWPQLPPIENRTTGEVVRIHERTGNSMGMIERTALPGATQEEITPAYLRHYFGARVTVFYNSQSGYSDSGTVSLINDKWIEIIKDNRERLLAPMTAVRLIKLVESAKLDGDAGILLRAADAQSPPPERRKTRD